MPTEPRMADSGSYRLLPPSPEAMELQKASRRLFVASTPAEIAGVLTEAALRYSGARSAALFLRDPGSGTFSGGDPLLLPEPVVVDFIFADSKPLVLPHREGMFIAVFPLLVEQERVGLLVLDVTGMAEEITRKGLEPVSLLADQAAMTLLSRRLLARSQGESTLLANILDSITNAILTLDRKGCITRFNRNATAMFGLPGDVLGRPYEEVLAPEVAAAVRDLVKQVQEMGFALERMIVVKPAQGLEIHAALSASVLRDETLAPIGTILVCRDMTASHELERLRHLDRMKSEFVANVSHELKTPLTSIKAYTEALLDMARDEQMRSFLEVVDEESDRLLALINDLLNVSRIQSGRLKMKFTLVPPRVLLDEILGISKIQSEKHRILPEIAEGLPPMLLDKEKMKEVLINLLTNAIKYSPAGGDIHVRMRLEGKNLRIEVQDHGLGIPPEYHDRLFQAFSRVDASETVGIPGTGLGLAISKAIVDHHDGRIGFESEPGRGSTFFVLIPVRTEIRRGEAGSELGSLAE